MKLLLLGDFFYDYDYLTEDIEYIIKYINEHDYKVIVNLESTLANVGTPIKKRGPNLKSNQIVVDILKRMNCICVCLANNHAMDFGGSSLQFTINMLETAGIKCVGAGANISEAVAPAIYSYNGKKLIIQNYGWDIEETVYASKRQPGCAPLDRKEIVNRTYTIKKDNPKSILINIYHMGFEFNTYPMPLDIEFAHDSIDAGCDLIIGHHPHILQPKEDYCNRTIYYSLGNFYFGTRRNLFQKDYMREGIDNYGDYGIGVEFDVDTLESREICLFYNRNREKTIPCDVVLDNLLKNMANIQWEKSDYIDFVKEHAYKKNPILGLDDKKNRKLINELMRKYYVAEKIQFLKKSKVGTIIYENLKRRAF